MRILITSASEPAALCLGRLLSSRGHVVFAADTERVWGSSPARYSRAYTRFYRLHNSAVPSCSSPTSAMSIHELWTQLEKEIDLWIPFGDLPDEFEDTWEKNRTKLLWAPVFAKDAIFQDFARERVVGRKSKQQNTLVGVPLAYDVKEAWQVGEILFRFDRDKEWSLAPTPYSDSDECDTLLDSECGLEYMSGREGQIAISLQNLDDQRVELVDSLQISETRPYRMTEKIFGGTTYEAHSLVIDGEIRMFIVTSVAGNYTISRNQQFLVIPSMEQPLVSILYNFTKDFVSAYQDYHVEIEREASPRYPCIPPICQKRSWRLSMHLSVTFHVKEELSDSQLIRRITALSCSNKPHLSLILLASIHQHRDGLARAYTSPSESLDDFITVSAECFHPRGLYSFPVVVAEGWDSVKSLKILEKEYWLGIANVIMMVFVWALYFKEELWCRWDPLPAMVSWLITPTLDYTLRRIHRYQ